MSRVLSGRRLVVSVVVAFLVSVEAAAAVAPGGDLTLSRSPLPLLLASVGGGSGGTSGGAIWAKTWWNGNPQGPGPYVGEPPGGVAICIWHDLGPGLSDLNLGLSEASLPLSFWKKPNGGGHPGIWGVDQWADARLKHSTASDHFDLVACPDENQVPLGEPDVETNIPLATPPKSNPYYVWLFWDTVENPPSGGLPPLIGEAFDETNLPAPPIETSPAEVGGVGDSTVVNLPTWLWVNGDTWHTYEAVAAGGGLVATVWATPVSVRWTTAWNYNSPTDDPEHATTFGPEVLDQVCSGPGVAYDLSGAANQTTYCSFDFTQSTYGNYVNLRASVTWDVYWALSDSQGVVGGEGHLTPVVTTSNRPLRVLQVESVIASG